MKLNEEERQIMVNLEYERACSCLKQAEGNASMDFWDVVAIGSIMRYSMLYQHFL